MNCPTGCKSKTVALPNFGKNPGAHAPVRLTLLPEAEQRLSWSPITSGPFLGPVTRWVE